MDKLAFEIGVADGIEKTALKGETVGRAYAKRVANALEALGNKPAPAGRFAPVKGKVMSGVEKSVQKNRGYKKWLKRAPEDELGAFGRSAEDTMHRGGYQAG